MQHHLAKKIVQPLLVNFYLERRPRPNPTRAPKPCPVTINPNPNPSPLGPLGDKRSSGAVVRLRHVFRWRFSERTRPAEGQPRPIRQWCCTSLLLQVVRQIWASRKQGAGSMASAAPPTPRSSPKLFFFMGSHAFTMRCHYSAVPLQCGASTVRCQYSAVPILCGATIVRFLYSAVPLQCGSSTVRWHYSVVPIQCGTTAVWFLYSAVEGVLFGPVVSDRRA